MNQTSTLVVSIPDDVLELAREKGVEEYVPVVLDLARHYFPGASTTVVVEEDPEIDDIKHILVTREGVQLSVEQLLAAKDDYHRALMAAVPSTLICTFRVKPRLSR